MSPSTFLESAEWPESKKVKCSYILVVVGDPYKYILPPAKHLLIPWLAYVTNCKIQKLQKILIKLPRLKYLKQMIKKSL